MATRQVPWDALDKLVPTDVDEYWQLTRGFIDAIVREAWPEALALLGAMEPVERRDSLIAAEAETAQRTTPRVRVIAAGSTGSMPATAKFLDAVARLPQGAVVLPGLDTDLDDDFMAGDRAHGDDADLAAGRADDIRNSPCRPCWRASAWRAPTW